MDPVRAAQPGASSQGGAAQQQQGASQGDASQSPAAQQAGQTILQIIFKAMLDKCLEDAQPE